jgi:uncharacterized membrane protein
VPGRGRRLLSAARKPEPHPAKAWQKRHRRIAFGSSVAVALIVYFGVSPWFEGASQFCAAYDAFALTLLAFFWLSGLHDDPQKTRERAAEEDPGRNIVGFIVLFAVVVGLVAAVAIIGRGPDVAHPLQRYEAYALAFIAISAGWVLVHTVYTFRYAHLYYFDEDGDGCGGIKFPGTGEPSDTDFAYFSFCVGTSFAVSDPQVTETRVRREVIGHSIISFAYNSVIVAIMINLFANVAAGK